MKDQIAFIDESGNFGFDFKKPGVSTHFIVTSIIVDKLDLSLLENDLEKVRARYFQTGEIKSSGVGNDDRRRIIVLKEIVKTPFHIFSIVFDKRLLTGKGFQYKSVFFKYLHGFVDRELFRTFPEIKIVADQYGSKEFQESFLKYIRSKHVPDLFKQSDFRFTDSKSELLVQLADFISGTLGKCFNAPDISPGRSDFLKIIEPRIINVEFWPKTYIRYSYNIEKDFKNFDKIIADLGINLANQFIKEHEKYKHPLEFDQINCLNYLLFYFQNISPLQYVTTKSIMSSINYYRKNDIAMHYFRSKVIAKLRDWGVIISSCNHGYKLPANNKDLFDFVSHSNSYIKPMIDRIAKCRNRVKLATKNKVDILDHDAFMYLKEISEYK